MSIIVAIVVGHTPKRPGAVNKTLTVTEYGFNYILSREISEKVLEQDKLGMIRPIILHRETTLQNLPSEISETKANFIISLHCNAYNRKASGTETLYYHSSKKGEKFATILQEHLVGALGLPNRGIKAKHSEDRGGYLLRFTTAPCVIAEPFFIDNDHDLETAIARKEKLVLAYADAIIEISNNLYK